jgi:hypothetical protein
MLSSICAMSRRRRAAHGKDRIESIALQKSIFVGSRYCSNEARDDSIGRSRRQPGGILSGELIRPALRAERSLTDRRRKTVRDERVYTIPRDLHADT